MSFPFPGTLSVQTVAAAGSATGDATQITTRQPALIVATGANGTKGVKLPIAAAGKAYFVKNNENAVLKVYPSTGDGINALTTGDPISMAALTAAVFVASSGTQWFTFSLLPS